MKNLKYWLRQLFNMLLLFLGGKPRETAAQKMYRLLSPIPGENWMCDMFTDGKGKCCFIGHYQRLTHGNPDDYSTKNCTDWNSRAKPSLARSLTRRFLQDVLHIAYDGSDVNNRASVNGYTENNPKDRIMHLLQDMIKAGY